MISLRDKTKDVYWQAIDRSFFKGQLLAICEDGILVHRVVPAGASYIPVAWDLLDEFETIRLKNYGKAAA